MSSNERQSVPEEKRARDLWNINFPIDHALNRVLSVRSQRPGAEQFPNDPDEPTPFSVREGQQENKFYEFHQMCTTLNDIADDHISGVCSYSVEFLEECWKKLDTCLILIKLAGYLAPPAWEISVPVAFSDPKFMGYLDKCWKLVCVSRRKRYGQARMPCWPLPENLQVFTLLLNKNLILPLSIRARLIGSKGMISTGHRYTFSRYGDEASIPTEQDLIRDIQAYPWISEERCEGDMLLLTRLAALLTVWELESTGLLDSMLHDLQQNGLVNGEKIAILMQIDPATDEAIAKGEKHCAICLTDFNLDRNIDYEPAYKTRCGHFFGLACLCEWKFREGSNSKKCPTCRSFLWRQVDLFLPGPLGKAAIEFANAYMEGRELDDQLDRFFENCTDADLKGIFGANIGMMMEALFKRCKTVFAAEFHLRKTVNAACGFDKY